ALPPSFSGPEAEESSEFHEEPVLGRHSVEIGPESATADMIDGRAPRHPTDEVEADSEPAPRFTEQPEVVVKSVVTVESPAESPLAPPPTWSPLLAPAASALLNSLTELWEPELRSARRRLEPEGSLTGATRELQAGL